MDVKQKEISMGISLQTAREEQLNEISEMMADFNAIYNYSFHAEMVKANLIEFIHNPLLGRLWVIVQNEETIGYIVLTLGFSFEYKGLDSFIDEFYIKEAYRGKGIGGEVLANIENQARELGVKAIHLELEKHNEKGSRLYYKSGYADNNRILLTKLIL